MPKEQIFLKNDDLYNYLLDKVNVTFYLNLFHSRDRDAFEVLKFSRNKTFRDKPDTLDHPVVITKKPGMVMVSYYFEFNFNRELREYYRKELGIERLTGALYEQDTNVIPLPLRRLLAGRGITLAAMRNRGIKLFFKEMDRTQEALRKYLIDVLAIPIGPDRILFDRGLQHLELCQDIVTAPMEELAANEKIRANFNIVTAGWKNHMREEGTSYIRETSGAELVGAASAGGDKRRALLQGWHADTSEEACYLKGTYDLGSINRAERIFIKDALIKIFGKLSITTVSNFKEKINTLAEITFKTHVEIYNVEDEITEQRKHDKLKGFCHGLFGSDWELAFDSLWNKGSIHTGKAGAADYKRVARKALALAKGGILLKAKSGRRGVYAVNWSWVFSNKFKVKTKGLEDLALTATHNQVITPNRSWMASMEDKSESFKERLIST